MIERLKKQHVFDVLEFTKRVNDKYQDFYVTLDKQRKFLKDIDTIKKILTSQEVYGYYNKELLGIILIYREKGFRTYLKFLAQDRDAENKMIKFFMWNCTGQELYLKLKKINPLVRYFQNYGFIFAGDRGQELLLCRRATKINYKIISKDLEEGE